MASAHYFFRNYDIKQVINLVCYMTEFPHTLTSTQKITRLYRYLPTHVVAFSGGKRNGLSEKIDAILPITIVTFVSPERGLRHCLPCLKVLHFLGRLWSISRSVSVRTLTLPC